MGDFMERRNNVLEVSEATKRRYMRNLAEQMRDLRSSMEKSDFKGIQEICHRVQGSASLFGLKDLGDACRSMEQAAKDQNLEEIVQCFQVIEVIVARNSGLAEAQGA
jgi:HPt (histidine-containing phosphotransfer) domain-containing protein